MAQETALSLHGLAWRPICLLLFVAEFGGLCEGVCGMSVAATQERENPGQKILASARELFYERGYGGVGINEIIERSGTSKKSFYNYYESKQELGAACLAAEEQDLGAWAARFCLPPKRVEFVAAERPGGHLLAV